MIQLFKQFPNLKNNLPWISFGHYPTPVTKLDNMTTMLQCKSLWMKRDDKTSPGFGGNKVRKLEIELAYIQQQNYQSILAYGPFGSNFTAACCYFANKLGIPVHLLLFKTVRSPYVDFNYALNCQQANSLSLCSSPIHLPIHILVKKIQYRHEKIYLMPPGGSSPLSIIGYINAMFELKEQIARNELPCPDYIFLPVGTGGTLIGLVIAKVLLNLAIKIIGIAVVEKWVSHRQILKLLLWRAMNVFNKLTGLRLKLSDLMNELIVDYRFIGKGYSHQTAESQNAINLLKNQQNIILDGSYTGKAMAGMLDYVKNKLRPEDHILFWHSYHAKFNPQEKEV